MFTIIRINGIDYPSHLDSVDDTIESVVRLNNSILNCNMSIDETLQEFYDLYETNEQIIIIIEPLQIDSNHPLKDQLTKITFKCTIIS